MKKRESKPTRPKIGRGVFYTRDSGGRHETTPAEYVRWAQEKAKLLDVSFGGTPELIQAMIRDGSSQQGDIFLDWGVSGNKLSRVGLDSLIQTALSDRSISHVFVPRRDRLARPDDAMDALQLEGILQKAGLTLVFMDRVLTPIGLRGQRDIVESIVGLLEYDKAGGFRRELSQKILLAQISLARAGFSTGGRPPFGFRRWLVDASGRPDRELRDQERVRMQGHHVVWLPGPEPELALIQRILTMLEAMPASRVAATLTSEGIPTPDANRYRTDNGVRHRTSGVWHANTVTNIARNPLLVATTSYGRRSMGDQLRFGSDGPRALTCDDLRDDEQPRVVANPPGQAIVATAKFDPLVDIERRNRLVEELDHRGGRQRAKPRSRTPESNPLGTRVFDMACGWPMYRAPYLTGFRYSCGKYMQSHGAECRHNHVDGPTAARFVLGCIRQRLLSSSSRAKLERRLRELAMSQKEGPSSNGSLSALKASLAEVAERKETIARNLALAPNQDQYCAISAFYEQTAREEEALKKRFLEEERSVSAASDTESEIEAALADFDHLSELASDPAQLGSIGDLFNSLNARLFLSFREVQSGKRKLNKIAGGVVTFGASEPPVALYEGPTGRRALGSKTKTPDKTSGVPQRPFHSTSSDREGNSLGNVSRGDRI